MIHGAKYNDINNVRSQPLCNDHVLSLSKEEAFQLDCSLSGNSISHIEHDSIATLLKHTVFSSRDSIRDSIRDPQVETLFQTQSGTLFNTFIPLYDVAFPNIATAPSLRFPFPCLAFEIYCPS
jgi:hypothetical protein